MRIAIAGFQHETNTFISQPTELKHFEMADSWPGLIRGSDVLRAMQGMNLPTAGFIDAARCMGDVDIHPVLWCAAEPWGKVTDNAFEAIAGWILDDLAHHPKPDAIYLDLHGAMVTQSHEDGEGALLARIRAAMGHSIPLVASLDMHANVSEQMVRETDALTIFRTYPHLDMAETGARAFHLLHPMIGVQKPFKAWRQADYLIPLPAQHTESEPARGLYRETALCADQGISADLAVGFTAADVYDAGPSVVSYAQTQAEADRIADHLLSHVVASRHNFDTSLLNANDAVEAAIAVSSSKPAVIADVQDNPGAGATSDTTGILRALVAQNAPSSVVGLIHDPNLAAAAHQAGAGAEFSAKIGGSWIGDHPYEADVIVTALSDGNCRYTGQMYGGGFATMGPTALLRISGTLVSCVVTSIRNQCLDQVQFRHLGVNLDLQRIICVKSTAHFRADFEPLASRVFVAAVPGAFPCEIDLDQYTNLRKSLAGPVG